MTSREHLLMISMLTRQLQLTKTLIEILQSRNVLERDGLQAFDALVRSDQKLSGDLLDETRDFYLAAAKALRVPIRLAT